MRPIRDNDTIQIEITSFCPHNCSNCTRFCRHYKKPWFMDFDTFTRAVDSLVGFKSNQGIGIMGGEPLFHPDFERFCKYAASKIDPSLLGLWSCFPEEKAHFGELISDTFSAVFPNDHTRPDVIHMPFLVSIEEVIPLEDMWYVIDHCWAQNSWSASINPKGAFFCEIAAAMAMLFDDESGVAWPVEPTWWHRTPIDYSDQIKRFCPMCGGALRLEGRYSNEGLDDVSPIMLDRLRMIESPKVTRNECVVHNLKISQECRRTATYKDENYRNAIVAKYGLFLEVNRNGFMTPFKKIVGG